MKKIILALLFIGSFSFGQVSSRTTNFELPQWKAGNKLNAGTENDSTVSNDGLNNGFSRLDAIVGRYIKENGRFSGIVGYGTGDLSINAGTDTTSMVTVSISDSVSVAGNINVALNGLISGNLTVGGYISVDSIVASQNLTFSDTVSFLNNVIMYDTLDADVINATSFHSIGGRFDAGEATSTDGAVRFYNSNNSYYTDLSAPNTTTSNKAITLPNRSGVVALQTGNDSLVAPNVNYQLYAQQMADAGTAAGDTSGYDGARWSQDGTTFVRKMKTLYVHKTGDALVKAYFLTAVSALNLEAGWYKLTLTNINNSVITEDSISSVSTSGYLNKTIALTVSGLTNQTPYFVSLSLMHGDGAGYFAYAKDLVILVQSE